MNQFPEPPVSPDDTSPSQMVRPPELRQRLAQQQTYRWQRFVGGLSLLGAAVFMVGTLVVLLLPGGEATPTPTQDTNTIGQAPTTAPTENVAATLPPTTAPLVVVTLTDGEAPLASADQIASLLAAPLAAANPMFNPISYDPFTIIKGDRPRSDFESYTVVKGDTIDAISKRYNIKPDSIAWCNDRRIIFMLRIGDVLKIPPMDGVCHTVIATREETAAKLATQYKIANPMDIIDFPLNNLYGKQPSDLLPGNLTVFVPNGQGEVITWNPGYDQKKDENGNAISVTFARGQSGSCGEVNPGGGTGWGNPLPSGRWVRGFYSGHSGIDLSAPVGTPIYAANSGPVIFSGFSRWGYGNAVVLAHGPYSTLYGHMSERSVSCGQVVVVGQVVGLVGSTGNSTGPHLHFEIRFNDVPQNPSGTPGVGW